MNTEPENRHRPLVLAAGSLLDHDAARLVRTAAAAGFDGVGLRLSGEHAVTSDRQADELRRMAEDLGVMIHDAEVLRIDDSWSPAGDRPPEPARRLLETAALLGAAAVLVVSDLHDESATSVAVDGLVAAASPLGLTIGLEYMAWTMPATAAGALDMAAATGCRVVVDVLHHVRGGAGVDELRKMIDAGHLGWVQLCDAITADAVDPVDFDRDDVIHEARHRRLPPGQGALPLAELLAEVPSDAIISVEVQSDDLAVLAADNRADLLATASRRLV